MTILFLSGSSGENKALGKEWVFKNIHCGTGRNGVRGKKREGWMSGAADSGDMKFKDWEKQKQGIPVLLNVMKTSCKKLLSGVDVTYFYSSTLWYNLSLHLAGGNGPVIFQVCWQRLPRVNICHFPEWTMPFRFWVTSCYAPSEPVPWTPGAPRGSAPDSSSTILRILHHPSRCADSCWYSFLDLTEM